MKKNAFIKILSFVTLLSLTGANTIAQAQIQTQAEIKQSLVDALSTMRSVYASQYAPKEWKRKFSNWDLNQAYQDAVMSVNALDQIDAVSAREIIKKFIYSTRDYHVSVRFFATDSASLPFTVKSVGDRAFITYINRAKLSVDAFPFKVGDEIIEFAGMKVNDAIQAVQNEVTANVAETDRALADLSLTNRRAARGLKVPSGVVELVVLPKGATASKKLQLIWDYTPEQISLFPNQRAPKNKMAQNKFGMSGLQMAASNITQDFSAEDNPFTTGTKKSYLPSLGQKIWEADDANTYDAYMVLTPEKKIIGVVRIPGYSLADAAAYDKAMVDFAGIINLFQVSTDSMVIDQINNPGGSVFYLYALVSMLSDSPMQAPRHRMSIIQADVKDAIDSLKQLESVVDDETAQKALGKSWSGFPVNYQVAQFVKGHFSFILNEWNAGRTITNANFLYGADQINPSRKANFTKPILVLVNELCFSGGDFFPTILQDNKRATIMGVRTAGAGGYVRDMKIPNLLGIESFRVTASIAERVDLNPIENLGVTPDVKYSLTVDDLQSGFTGYRDAVKSQIDLLMAR